MSYFLEFTGYLACNQQLAKNGGGRIPLSPPFLIWPDIHEGLKIFSKFSLKFQKTGFDRF